MRIETSQPKCSVCDQQHSEFFQRENMRGRRCLSCGHEVIYTDQQGETVEYSEWTNHTKESF